VAVAALIISVLALLASGASVLYARRQAIHAGAVAAIEMQRSHAELTPLLTLRPDREYHDDPNAHDTSINITNGASFSLQRISARAITDRPDKHAIIAIANSNNDWVSDESVLVLDRLDPGQTRSFKVVLAWDGERSQSGVLSLEVHDAAGESWIIEAELEFPSSPTMYAW